MWGQQMSDLVGRAELKINIWNIWTFDEVFKSQYDSMLQFFVEAVFQWTVAVTCMGFLQLANSLTRSTKG